MLPCDKYSTRHYVLPLLPPIQQYSGFFNAMQVFCLMSEREKKNSAEIFKAKDHCSFILMLVFVLLLLVGGGNTQGAILKLCEK